MKKFKDDYGILKLMATKDSVHEEHIEDELKEKKLQSKWERKLKRKFKKLKTRFVA
jgi:hypothetical protein